MEIKQKSTAKACGKEKKRGFEKKENSKGIKEKKRGNLGRGSFFQLSRELEKMEKENTEGDEIDKAKIGKKPKDQLHIESGVKEEEKKKGKHQVCLRGD